MEIWKDIQGYEGIYQISNFGRVRSFKLDKVKILKPAIDKDGYKIAILYKNKKKKTCRVHRIVAETFIQNSENLTQVNHKNENKLDNCVNNLEFCTNKYNSNYGTRNERLSVKLTNRKDQSKSVLQFTKTGEFVAEYPSNKEAERQTGINNGNISLCCIGKRKSTGGYIWKYKNEE